MENPLSKIFSASKTLNLKATKGHNLEDGKSRKRLYDALIPAVNWDLDPRDFFEYRTGNFAS